MSTLADSAIVILRVGGIAIAVAWLLALMRVRQRAAFDGQRRVELIAIAFIFVGLAAIAASLVSPAGR